MTAKLVWKYEVTDKVNTFKQYSPVWNVHDKDGASKELASEDKKNDWSWSESSECPESYKGRISKEDQATLVISSIALSDTATYDCSLHLEEGSPITSKVKLIAYGKHYKLGTLLQFWFAAIYPRIPIRNKEQIFLLNSEGNV